MTDFDLPINIRQVLPDRFQIDLKEDVKWTVKLYKDTIAFAEAYPVDNCTYYTLVPTDKYDTILKKCGFRLACLKTDPENNILRYWVKVND